ncbi:hypothetical protein [Nocardia sp. NPDC059236]
MAGAMVFADYVGDGSDLEVWIHEALDVMAAHGIPDSYAGIWRNYLTAWNALPRLSSAATARRQRFESR